MMSTSRNAKSSGQSAGTAGRRTVLRAKSARRAFSVLEVTIVAALTGFLLLMISSVWIGLGRALTDTIVHGKVVSEAEMALDTIRRDLRGSLPGTELGTPDEGRLVGQLVSGGNQLLLCYDGGAANGVADWAAPDFVVRYEVQGGQLVRVDQNNGTVFLMADYVDDFRVTALTDAVRLELDLLFRDFDRSYVLEVQTP